MSEESIRREFYEIGGTPYFVYTQPLRKGDQKREIENLISEQDKAELHETYRRLVENGNPVDV